MKKLLITASTCSHICQFHKPYLAAFHALGWEVHVACAGIPKGAGYADRAIDVPFQKRFVSLCNLRALRLLKALIREENYDLILTHTSLAAFYTRLAVKGTAHPPLVNVVHGYLFDEKTSFLKRSILLCAERLTAPDTDLLLTMNEWDHSLTKRVRLAKRVGQIPGIGLDDAHLRNVTAQDGARVRSRLGLDENAFVLIYAAEFSKRKSQSVLLEMMTLLPRNVALLLPGSGNLLRQCQAEIQRLGLSGRVILPGHVQDLAPWYRAADAAVTSSRSEGLPFNVMEAMDMGLPVVASAVKGHVDLIRDGVTGLLYPYGDSAAAAACIRRLLDQPELCRKLGEQAREDVQPYLLEPVLPVVMEAYLSALPDTTQTGGTE